MMILLFVVFCGLVLSYCKIVFEIFGELVCLVIGILVVVYVCIVDGVLDFVFRWILVLFRNSVELLVLLDCSNSCLEVLYILD